MHILSDMNPLIEPPKKMKKTTDLQLIHLHLWRTFCEINELRCILYHNNDVPIENLPTL